MHVCVRAHVPQPATTTNNKTGVRTDTRASVLLGILLPLCHWFKGFVYLPDSGYRSVCGVWTAHAQLTRAQARSLSGCHVSSMVDRHPCVHACDCVLLLMEVMHGHAMLARASDSYTCLVIVGTFPVLSTTPNLILCTHSPGCVCRCHKMEAQNLAPLASTTGLTLSCVCVWVWVLHLGVALK